MNFTDEGKTEIIQELKEGIIEVQFTKVNGDKRVMTCTLSTAHLPLVEKAEPDELPKTERKENLTACSVWDMNAKGWRSFRWDNVTQITGTKNSI